MASDWEKRQRMAWSIGYEGAYQRRELRAAARGQDYEDLRARLDPLIAQREGEGDFASIGEIFADLYDELPDMDNKTAFLRGIISPTSV